MKNWDAKMSNNTVGIFNKLNDRFDDIEKLLQMLLVNELIEETEQIIESAEMVVPSELKILMSNFFLKYGELSTINDVQVFITEVPEGTKLKISDYRLFYSKIRSYYPDREPLFIFKTINGMQRKRFMQEEISFGVKGKEIHVFNKGKRR